MVVNSPFVVCPSWCFSPPGVLTICPLLLLCLLVIRLGILPPGVYPRGVVPLLVSHCAACTLKYEYRLDNVGWGSYSSLLAASVSWLLSLDHCIKHSHASLVHVLLARPAFYVSFVVTPICSNASELVSSLMFAAKKTKTNISMTYSQVTASLWSTGCLFSCILQSTWIVSIPFRAFVAESSLLLQPTLYVVSLYLCNLHTSWVIFHLHKCLAWRNFFC